MESNPVETSALSAIVEQAEPTALRSLSSANTVVELAQSYGVIPLGEIVVYRDAVGTLQGIKGMRNNIDKERRDLVDPLNGTVKKINAKYKPATDALDEAERILKTAILDYDRRAEAAARAEEERLRKIQQAEQERLQREAAEAQARAKAEAAEHLRLAEEAARQGNDQAADEAVQQAQAIQQQAADTAQAIQEQIAVTPPAIVTPEKPKVAGISRRKKWRARVTDMPKFIKAVAGNPQYMNLLEVNQSALDKLAGSLEDKLNIDGVDVYAEAILGSRAA